MAGMAGSLRMSRHEDALFETPAVEEGVVVGALLMLLLSGGVRRSGRQSGTNVGNISISLLLGGGG